MILFALLQARADVWSPEEVAGALIRPLSGVVVAILLYQLVRRTPWTGTFRLRFVARHAAAVLVLTATWALLTASMMAVLFGGSIVARIERRWDEHLFVGVILYTLLAGLFYAVESSARAVRAEGVAARTQLAALRAQIHPHFLFNALHTVVQLIPIEPQRAAEAAELVADLLRTTLEETRDEVPLDDEWRFVTRYLTLERMRFGDRLVVREVIADAMMDERVPAFALQTLVENAVQHGAAPRVAPTEIVVAVTGNASELRVSVRNSGDVPARAASASTGTGLARLRERLAALYGDSARLQSGPHADGGYEAVLVVPRRQPRAA